VFNCITWSSVVFHAGLPSVETLGVIDPRR
jgi:hypothetical protein